MLIQVKKQNVLNSGDESNRKGLQAIANGQLIALGLIREEATPVVLLTDLMDVWSFC